MEVLTFVLLCTTAHRDVDVTTCTAAFSQTSLQELDRVTMERDRLKDDVLSLRAASLDRMTADKVSPSYFFMQHGRVWQDMDETCLPCVWHCRMEPSLLRLQRFKLTQRSICSFSWKPTWS